MRLHDHLLGDRQLAVGKGVDRAAHGFAANRRNHDRSPTSSVRSACLARVSRDLTVPTATPSEKAISS